MGSGLLGKAVKHTHTHTHTEQGVTIESSLKIYEASLRAIRGGRSIKQRLNRNRGLS